ncbi:MAG: hypothetical protein ACXVH3_05335 [Solirubrobacteraceae bacterium]
MSVRRPRAVRSGAIVTMCALFGLVVPAIGRAAGPYVSLGDSYTSAPLVPVPTGNPIGCGRSTNNYPSDVARVIQPSSFTDVSCGSATTVNMTQPQSVPFGGTNPPQFNALSTGDSLVTVGIGGNDAGLIGVVEECVKLDVIRPTGSACRTTTRRLVAIQMWRRSGPPRARSRRSSRASICALQTRAW